MMEIRDKNSERLFLFDFDGVIVDSLKEATDAIGIFLGTFNIKQPTMEEIRRMYQKNIFDSFKEMGVPDDGYPKLYSIIKERSVQYESWIPMYEGVNNLLSALKDDAIYIVSSSSTRAMEKYLAKYNLSGYFKEVLGAENGTSKVEKISKILAKEKPDLARTYFVTDTTGDIKEGKKAGVKTIAVGWGYHHPEDLQAEKPDYLFLKMRDFIKAIPGL
ncbi:MAG: HAD-IA family hydrolase [Patescibacteria group bacterium]|jgi:phosphoglycolate phosphatase